MQGAEPTSASTAKRRMPDAWIGVENLFPEQMLTGFEDKWGNASLVFSVRGSNGGSGGEAPTHEK
jgi:hypothetical protein